MRNFLVLASMVMLLVSCAPGMEDLPKLQAKLSQPNVEERQEAVEKIGKIKDATPAVLPVLYKALESDTSPTVRTEAAKSLQKLGFSQAASELEKALAKDASPDVRVASANALHGLAGFNALDVLVGGTNDTSEQVRAACVACIGQIGGEKAATIAREMLTSDTSPMVRKNAVAALARMQDAQGYSLIEKAAFEDQSMDVRTEAVIAVGSYPGEKSMEVLCRALKDASLKDAAITAISKNNRARDSEEAIGLIMAEVDANPKFIDDDRVIEIFVASGDQRVKPYFRQYILYPYCNRDTIKVIAKRMRNSGDLSLVPQLLSDIRSTSDSDVITNICTALGYFGDRRATPVMVSMLRNRDSYKSCVTRQFIWVLSALNDPDAYNYLCQMCCNEKDRDIRDAACRASSDIYLSNTRKLKKCPCWNR